LVKNIFLNRIFGTTDGKTLTKSYAVFGDGSYAVNSKMNLNGGLRLTSEKKNGIASMPATRTTPSRSSTR